MQGRTAPYCGSREILCRCPPLSVRRFCWLARGGVTAFPLDQPIDALPQSVVELTPKQKRALVEIEKRLEQRQQEWASIVHALEDNSMAVFRAMRQGRNESEQEQVERVLTGFEDGRFLIDRMGAENTVDPDL